MSVFIILFISLLSHEVAPSIHEMPLSEIYLKADDMKTFDFGFTNYTESVKSKGFDFVSLKPVNQKGNGYFESYYNEEGVQKVVKFSGEDKKEYVVFVDTRNEGYSFLWMFFYGKHKLMANGFFLNIAEKGLYFMGLSEPMGSLLEILNSEGEVEKFDFGQIYTLPEGNVGSVIGQIASVDGGLLPLSILHFRAGNPFGVEYLKDATLHVFSFTEQDCEEDIPNLSELEFTKISLILEGSICFEGKVFGLRDQCKDLRDYYAQRTF